MKASLAVKQGSGELRREVEPLTKRFAVLGTPASAIWSSGTLGDDRAPGPSSYWIDAIVTLTPAQAQALRRAHTLTPAPAPPAVVDALRPRLPPAPLMRADSLDEALSQSGFVVHAVLAGEVLVLEAKGQGT